MLAKLNISARTANQYNLIFNGQRAEGRGVYQFLLVQTLLVLFGKQEAYFDRIVH